MGTQIGNGHTGTEHMTAARWQAVFKSLWGSDNVVFKTGSELAITVTPGTGTVTIADGVFSFNGVLGTVETSDSATYVKPASEGAYAKIGVAIKYTKNSETLVESLDVVCLKSTETTSVELAQALTIDYGDNTIDGATTEAHYPLYEFIANSIADSNIETLFKTVDTLPTLAAKLATAQGDIADEITARGAADTTLQGNIDELKPVLVQTITLTTSQGTKIESSLYSDYDYMILEFSSFGIYKMPTSSLNDISEIVLPGQTTVTVKFVGTVPYTGASPYLSAQPHSAASGSLSSITLKVYGSNY